MNTVTKQEYKKPAIVELSSASGTLGMGSTGGGGAGVQKLAINPESQSNKTSPS